MDGLAKMLDGEKAKKGENPGSSLEDLLITLLTSMLITVIHNVLTGLSTSSALRKLLGAKE